MDMKDFTAARVSPITPVFHLAVHRAGHLPTRSAAGLVASQKQRSRHGKPLDAFITCSPLRFSDFQLVAMKWFMKRYENLELKISNWIRNELWCIVISPSHGRPRPLCGTSWLRLLCCTDPPQLTEQLDQLPQLPHWPQNWKKKCQSEKCTY